ncbi:hypothetical protein TNCV_1588961 [Trichonephila clavipes]|uniref:Uncharacterized protein n=1 Tax=Trichonephila clavipes TaxID=2585209 RepID=A0A8X6V5B8_TRICX|nr:hypothetical protein TNCV_1588961 [Trichonephila clavipes]
MSLYVKICEAMKNRIKNVGSTSEIDFQQEVTPFIILNQDQAMRTRFELVHHSSEFRITPSYEPEQNTNKKKRQMITMED